jgi:hypothetical protein
VGNRLRDPPLRITRKLIVAKYAVRIQEFVLSDAELLIAYPLALPNIELGQVCSASHFLVQPEDLSPFVLLPCVIFSHVDYLFLVLLACGGVEV